MALYRWVVTLLNLAGTQTWVASARPCKSASLISALIFDFIELQRYHCRLLMY